MLLPGWRSVWWGILDMCRDHRHLIACQKQHRQNELAGQVDVPSGVEVRVTGDPGHMKRPRVSHCMSKTTQKEWTSWSGRSSYQGGGPCDRESRICVGTTDVSCLSKTTQTEWTSWSGTHSYWGGGQCEGGSRTLVGTTDISPSVKNNTDRMNQLVR